MHPCDEFLTMHSLIGKNYTLYAYHNFQRLRYKCTVIHNFYRIRMRGAHSKNYIINSLQQSLEL